MNHKKNVLTIAGSDSSGGAGIQADLKTFEALNLYGASVITSITAQNTCGVQEVYDLPDWIVSSQLESVLSDIAFSAIKIGMLKTKDYIHIVANRLAALKIPIVLDPVMMSSSGRRLLDQEATSCMIDFLFPLTTLITPNIPEAAILLKKDEKWVMSHLRETATQLLTDYPLNAVLLKGGHLDSNNCIDTLAVKDYSFEKVTKVKIKQLSYPRLSSINTHGTGCTLASAISAYLAQGNPLECSIEMAGQFLQQALKTANLQSVGKGTGPLNHHGAVI